MAKFWYSHGLVQLGSGTIDLAAGDIRVMLVMTATTCDTEFDKITLTGAGPFTNIDEFDGSGYTAGGVALTSQSVALTLVPDRRVKVDALDVNFGTLDTGTRDIQGYLVYDFDSDTPILFDDSPSALPGSPSTENVTIQWSTDGWTFLQSNPNP